ncbi:MAG: phosphoenolpyruvate mutase [Alphaproteobacteria bacterium]
MAARPTPKSVPTPAAGPAPSKPAQLRAELFSPALSFIMEAHNGLSAKIVEEAGFKGIWASGLSMSSALGVRDNNEASWTQVLDQLEFMSDATSIPILVDGDTGYGNFNNVRRLVRKLCQRHIAGVCIEDKLFPKTNSFIGEAQPLADIDEFCGRIKAGKDSQTDDDFVLVARIEALISGWGLDEALHRAEAYHAAGADAILIHSKKSTADEIFAFSREWAGRSPIVIVPTMYYRTPTEAFEANRIGMVIWANHNLRAAITAMRAVSHRIMQEKSLAGIEGEIASVKEVFELVGQGELSEAESRYLAPSRPAPRAIVLAATQGTKLGPLTATRPKCMLDVRGQPLLRRLVATLNESGVRDITVVRGFAKETVDLANIKTVDNDRYAETGEVASLACAEGALDGECILSYGDILFRPHIVDDLIAAEGDIVLVADARWESPGHRAPDREVDRVACERAFTGSYLDEAPVSLVAIATDLPPEATHGEFIGLVKLSAAGTRLVRGEIAAMRADGSATSADLPALLTRLMAKGVPVSVVYTTGHWLDVDDAFDLAKARNLM